MSDDRRLIPVFIPPLVSLLAHAEEQKGRPLTEAEVLEIRGRGICMMTGFGMKNRCSAFE